MTTSIVAGWVEVESIEAKTWEGACYDERRKGSRIDEAASDDTTLVRFRAGLGEIGVRERSRLLEAMLGKDSLGVAPGTVIIADGLYNNAATAGRVQEAGEREGKAKPRRRACYWGLPKVTVQVLLNVIIVNLKRAAKLIRARAAPTPVAVAVASA